ncbi:MAG: acyl carrier protein [Clostridia bacterium]|mgnify:FL=1|nr:acyl carrier protein [Clostridia bacterium]
MVFDKVKSIIVDELMVDEADVTMEANIKDDLGADSLAVVDLAMSLEDEFGIEIPDNELENVKTVGDVVKLIESKNE